MKRSFWEWPCHDALSSPRYPTESVHVNVPEPFQAALLHIPREESNTGGTSPPTRLLCLYTHKEETGLEETFRTITPPHGEEVEELIHLVDKRPSTPIVKSPAAVSPLLRPSYPRGRGLPYPGPYHQFGIKDVFFHRRLPLTSMASNCLGSSLYTLLSVTSAASGTTIRVAGAPRPGVYGSWSAALRIHGLRPPSDTRRSPWTPWIRGEPEPD